MDFAEHQIIPDTPALAVDPDTIQTKNPTPGPKCGKSSGSAAHRKRGERSCQDCLDAAAESRREWEESDDEAAENERRLRALSRPSLAVILLAYGVRDADRAIASLAKHGYGDYADALTLAAKECPVGVNIQTNGGAIRTWLRGRAGLIKKVL